MSFRTAIELSPLVCRLVRVWLPGTWSAGSAETRVESFAAMPLANLAMRQRFAELRRQRASVIVWGVPSEHRQVEVSNSSLPRMRAEAIDALRDLTGGAPIDQRRVLADIAPIGPRVKGARTRRVVVAVADAAQVRAAVQPVVDAGLRIDRIVTPALALMSLARLRRGASAPGVLEAYVALEETATCIAIVRDGALVSAREVAWGYLDDTALPRRVLRSRLDIVTQLGNELAVTFSPLSQGDRVAQVSVCGGLPDLRSTTIPLMDRFELEVETLDSLFGIDAANLPKPEEEFHDRVAELRLAWAVAADARTPLDLRQEERRRAAGVALSRAAAVAGVTVALGAGIGIMRSEWWRSTIVNRQSSVASRQPSTKGAQPAADSRPTTGISSRPPVASQPSAIASRPTPAASQPIVTSREPVATAPASQPAVATRQTPAMTPPAVPDPRPAAVQPPAVTSRPTPAATQPPIIARREPVANVPPVIPRQRTVPSRPPAIANRESSASNQPSTPPSAIPTTPTASSRAEASDARETPLQPQLPQGSARTQDLSPRARGSVARRAESPLPFDATLVSILYAPDRKLAIIDGRIVGLGDQVKGATVVDVTPSTVLLRDAAGRLRQLALAAAR